MVKDTGYKETQRKLSLNDVNNIKGVINFGWWHPFLHLYKKGIYIKVIKIDL